MTAEPGPAQIRPASSDDHEAIWEIFDAVVSAGDTYLFEPGLTRDAALAAWLPPDGHTFVAEQAGQVVGTYLLRPNQPGLGNHVANAGYMVRPGKEGRGLGAAMCRHSLVEARRLGFSAMQFNAVVSTNVRAVALWERMGFAVVGRVPGAFRHARLGAVDLLIMHRTL